MKILTAAVMVAGAVLLGNSGASAQPRPSGFYDELGQFRGQLWCFRRDAYVRDCSYYTYGQCMAAVQGLIGFCEQNPYSFASQPAPRPQKRKHRRHHRR